MIRIIFAHGWGFDKNFWTDTINEFCIERYYLLDFGYTGQRNIPVISQSLPLIGVGHSLGFAWLLKNLRNPTCLISVSGFDCFYNIHHRKSIEKMRMNIQRNKLAQMRAFHKMAGTKSFTCQNYEERFLMEGIDNLLTWNYRERLNSLTVPVFAIASENDKIIPVNTAKNIFQNCNLKITSGGNHVIPENNRSEYLKFMEKIFCEFRL